MTTAGLQGVGKQAFLVEDSNEMLAKEAAIPGPFQGKRAAVLLYSYYPDDPRPRREAEALASAGMTVDLICLRHGPDDPRRELIKGVNVTRMALKRRRTNKLIYVAQYLLFILYSNILLSFRCFRSRYDVVHVHNMPDFLVFSAVFAKLRGAKIILDLHDPMPELAQAIYDLPPSHWSVRLLKHLEKKAIAFAHLVLTTNEAFRNLFISRGCPPHKIQIVMNSPEEDIFNNHSVPTVSRQFPKKAFRLMYHGSLVPRYGLDLAIDALTLVRDSVPEIEIIVCGQHTPYIDSVIQSPGATSLGDRFKYLGSKTPYEIAQLIAGSDLGIVPNRRSQFTEVNMPMRIFEFLALGKPVIVPNTQGIRDYFNESSALFFETGSVQDLAKVIIEAYRNSKTVADIVARGRRVYAQHTWTIEKSHLLSTCSNLMAAQTNLRQM